MLSMATSKNHIRRVLCCAMVSAGICLSAQAQEKKTDWGKLHGGIDASGAVYKKDQTDPDLDSLGLNTYINLNYEYKKFTAGIQYEIFEPPMRGFQSDLKGNKLVQYFANYSTNNFGVTLGSFYEQFGSGLIFRSYEERSLGVNTSLRGLHVKYSPLEWISLKALVGQPRRYLDYADAMTYGADGDFIVSRLWNKDYSYNFSLGGGWILRQNTKMEENAIEPKGVNLFSVRSGFNNEHVNLGVEYTAKSKSQTFSDELMDYLAQNGDALLVNADYTREGFGISGVFRRVEHMDYRVDAKRKLVYIPMNYIPALTKQHKYTLPSLYPHQTNVEGEIGGQADIFWEIAPQWMGKYPLKLTFNASWYRTLGENANKTMPFMGKDGKDLFKEASVELEKRLNPSLKANIGFYVQEIYDKNTLKNLKSYIEVADILWKMNRKMSLRTEIQHMNTQMVEKAWIYGLMEFGLAPNWMVYASDMYNYGAENKEHFFNMGVSFAHKSLRASLAYGKHRPGIQCVGGICRFVPGYQGATATFSYVF